MFSVFKELATGYKTSTTSSMEGSLDVLTESHLIFIFTSMMGGILQLIVYSVTVAVSDLLQNRYWECDALFIYFLAGRKGHQSRHSQHAILLIKVISVRSLR